MLKAKQIFFNAIIQLKIFNDSLNIGMISAPGREVLSATYTPFPFTEWEYFSFEMAIIHFWDKPFLDINLKNHSDSVLLCK